VIGNKPDQSWRYGIQTPLESQASFSAVDRDEDRVALANKTSRLVTEAFNVPRFGTLLRVVLIDIRFFMYLGTLKTIAWVDHCYDETSHVLIADSEKKPRLQRPEEPHPSKTRRIQAYKIRS
jgi:hypothetical protein